MFYMLCGSVGVWVMPRLVILHQRIYLLVLDSTTRFGYFIANAAIVVHLFGAYQSAMDTLQIIGQHPDTIVIMDVGNEVHLVRNCNNDSETSRQAIKEARLAHSKNAAIYNAVQQEV